MSALDRIESPCSIPPTYVTTILDAHGETMTPPWTGRPKGACETPRADLNHATVEKVSEKGRVVETLNRVGFGTKAAQETALAGLRASRSIRPEATGAVPRVDAKHVTAEASHRHFGFVDLAGINPATRMHDSLHAELDGMSPSLIQFL